MSAAATGRAVATNLGMMKSQVIGLGLGLGLVDF
jgi:hypothetical protein